MRYSDAAWARRYVDWLTRHGAAVWIVVLIASIPAAYRTAQLYLHLKGDFEELLPKQAPSVIALETLRRRMPGLQYLAVVVDTGNAAALPQGERFIDDLATRVHTYPPELMRNVSTGDEVETAFIEKNAALYIDQPDLQTIHDRVLARKQWEELRRTFGSIDEEENPPSVDFEDLRHKYQAELPNARGSPRYSSPKLHATLMLIQVGGEFSTGNATGEQLYRRVRADIAGLGGIGAYGKGLKVGFGGDVAIYVEETEALAADLALSSVLVVIAVALVLLRYYRWWRSIFVLVPPLLLAVADAFAIASLPPMNVTVLNSNTAFLGSIIVGNGINFGIVLLARYVEERRNGFDVRPSLVTAIARSYTGTLAAALAAAVSYAALGITAFRGFRQFGIIGGIGMVLAWLFAYGLMPPLIAWLDVSAKTVPQPTVRRHSITGYVAGLVSRHYALIAVASCALTVLAVIPVSHFGKDQLETDVSKLRRRDTWTKGAGHWSELMGDVVGRYLTPMVILTDSEEDAQAVAEKLRAKLAGPLGSVIATVRTARDLVPANQPEKFALAKQIRAMISPRLLSRLDDEQKRAVDRFLGAPEQTKLTMEDVPASLKAAMRERDGTIGRSVLVYPVLGSNTWDGPTLAGMVDGIRGAMREALPSGHQGYLAGSLPVSADILEFMRRDGIITSAAALAGVVAVVFALMRGHRLAWYVIAALVTGVLYLLAAVVVFKIKINFANFIAFAITFGIGVDYAVNVATRYVIDGERDIRAAIASTGAAVALCSCTTIIGYASLLLAKNNALFLFGLLAVLGEITCLTVALTMMPSLMLASRAIRAAMAKNKVKAPM